MAEFYTEHPGIAQRELIAHWGTLRALGNKSVSYLSFPSLVPQCVQGSPMRNQFALRNPDPPLTMGAQSARIRGCTGHWPAPQKPFWRLV